MVVGGRRTSIAVFITLGAGLIAFIVLLYVGWVLLGWREGILLFFGILLVLAVIAGVVLNTTFLVREVRRNAQHDAFINAEKTGPLHVAEYSALLMQITEGKCYSIGEMRSYLAATGFEWRAQQDTAVARGFIIAERI